MGWLNLSNSKQTWLSWLLTAIAFALVILLFWEWLRPLPELTETHSLSVFLLFFSACAFLHLIRIPWYIRPFFLLGLIMYTLHHIYFFTPFWSKEWLLYIQEDLLQSLSLLVVWDIASLSFLFKTLLFFILIAYLASSLAEGILRRRNMFIFFLATILYLALLDTFSSYEAQFAIMRTFVVGFLLLAVIHLARMVNIPQKKVLKTSSAILWLGISMLLIISMSCIGYVAPKQEASWPDPLPYLQVYSSDAGFLGEPLQKVGYGEMDERLGGGFVQDDSIAFLATSPVKQYWRGESKDYYTGHGWKKSQEEQLLMEYDPHRGALDQDFSLAWLLEKGVQTEVIKSQVLFTEPNFSNIFYSGNIRNLAVEEQTFLQLDVESGRIMAWEDQHLSTKKKLAGYTLETDYPHFSVRSLEGADWSKVPADIQARYTQLPENLPSRVGELTKELTQNVERGYEQVKEVETYFRRADYRYETRNIPIPAADEDYVDQFLFETKRGYCDNFSTSMVVMLRTIDIPARWVKGFTSGEVKENDGEVLHTVVRNKNAHSWVEVYFPEIGWVPFEPTKTFINPVTFEREDWPNERENQQRVEEQARQRAELEKKKQEEQEALATMGNKSPRDGVGSTSLWWILLACFLLATLLLFSFLGRKRLLLRALRRYQEVETSQALLKGYELLILYLGRSVSRRKPSQTLREYIASLEAPVKSEELKGLTRIYEAVRYGEKKEEQHVMDKANELWKSMLRKMR